MWSLYANAHRRYVEKYNSNDPYATRPTPKLLPHTRTATPARHKKPSPRLVDGNAEFLSVSSCAPPTSQRPVSAPASSTRHHVDCSSLTVLDRYSTKIQKHGFSTTATTTTTNSQNHHDMALLTPSRDHLAPSLQDIARDANTVTESSLRDNAYGSLMMRQQAQDLNFRHREISEQTLPSFRYNRSVKPLPENDYGKVLLVDVPIDSPNIEKHLNLLKRKEKDLTLQRWQQEWEDVRGPRPRWYEMRSAAFSKELAKNRQQVADPGFEQRSRDYRGRLFELQAFLCQQQTSFCQ